MATTIDQVSATVFHAGMYPKLDKDQTVTGDLSHETPNDASKSSRKLQLDDFTKVRTIGQGTFARVCLVRLVSPRNEAERTTYR
ncbi:hypothetical protein F5883DRAFT_719204 [Diaporthe sp. PMI_573]|nr:hypothetical protein F5883DRAFT_719204 [Diaporthaceae sp. PMI_573]